MGTDIQNGWSSPAEPFRVLSLDGGGAKGFYTLGVLREIEALVGCRLIEKFDLIFGTSTGAIIGALLALGWPVDKIHTVYKNHVLAVMRHWTSWGRTRALISLANEVFEGHTFADFKTGIGIVATRWDFERPMIFKASAAQAHGREATFVPGFGCSVAEAVIASCSAYPFFRRPTLRTGKGDDVQLIDGGYCANNPTLFAIADALAALKWRPENLRVVSVGVGVYPEPRCWGVKGIVKRLMPFQLLQKTLNFNTSSMEQLRSLLYKDIQTVRINATFERPEMATDLLEHDPKKLNLLYQRGGESFAGHETALRQLLL